MVPTVSNNRGVCSGTPIALTTAEYCDSTLIFHGAAFTLVSL